MASLSFITSRSCRSNAQRRDLLCGHGQRPVLRVSNTKENTGRIFWGSVYYEIQAECDFFRWADTESGQEDLEISRLKRKVSSLKSRIKVTEWKIKIIVVLG
ncbi:hypothetical protein PIB30_048772 [Stylosanthes scabra]|uniref:GRF-type domain-containing protein n=1 Tax=Stylosanthes scabra TaxID=79078 RepID=A0ABU6THJ4_9FABA|nr:hypothetical protein [Stylosanthes scabra]